VKTDEKWREEWERRTRVQHEKDERVLIHLTDAAHAIAPCPDDGSVYHPYTDFASEFRAVHKRWPLWWEMAKLIHDYETSD
jgi:hypothetical protein